MYSLHYNKPDFSLMIIGADTYPGAPASRRGASRRHAARPRAPLGFGEPTAAQAKEKQALSVVRKK